MGTLLTIKASVHGWNDKQGHGVANFLRKYFWGEYPSPCFIRFRLLNHTWLYVFFAMFIDRLRRSVRLYKRVMVAQKVFKNITSAPTTKQPYTIDCVGADDVDPERKKTTEGKKTISRQEII